MQWGGDVCLHPELPPAPSSKEGLLHCSCLKSLLNKSSGYRGMFQPGWCSQLSSPARGRVRAEEQKDPQCQAG